MRELTEGVHCRGKDAGVPICCNRVGSMFTWFFTPGPDRLDIGRECDTEAFGRFFRAMLDHGIYLPPSQFEAAFLSAAHTEKDIQQTIAAAKQAFACGDCTVGQPDGAALPRTGASLALSEAHLRNV